MRRVASPCVSLAYAAVMTFRTIDELEVALREADYLPDRGLATALFLSLALENPVLLEGRASPDRPAGSSARCRDDQPVANLAARDAAWPADPYPPLQYTARPPEMSYVAPVENEHSSLASQHTSAATSFGVPIRPIGMRSTM